MTSTAAEGMPSSSQASRGAHSSLLFEVRAASLLRRLPRLHPAAGKAHLTGLAAQRGGAHLEQKGGLGLAGLPHQGDEDRVAAARAHETGDMPPPAVEKCIVRRHGGTS